MRARGLEVLLPVALELWKRFLCYDCQLVVDQCYGLLCFELALGWDVGRSGRRRRSCFPCGSAWFDVGFEMWYSCSLRGVGASFVALFWRLGSAANARRVRRSREVAVAECGRASSFCLGFKKTVLRRAGTSGWRCLPAAVPEAAAALQGM